MQQAAPQRTGNVGADGVNPPPHRLQRVALENTACVRQTKQASSRDIKRQAQNDDWLDFHEERREYRVRLWLMRLKQELSSDTSSGITAAKERFSTRYGFVDCDA